MIRAGRVSVDDRVCTDPERRTVHDVVLRIDGEPVAVDHDGVYLALNKPRGLVTTRSDERGRPTVYECLRDSRLPWVAPVGRLDQASEGLLLFSNDSAWAAGITSPESHLPKTYHVQVDCVPNETVLSALREGGSEGGDHLSASAVTILRTGIRNAWLEIVLVEGRNRQIRRMLAAHGIQVRRLVRVAIGSLTLGGLAKGAWRTLSRDEIDSLTHTAPDGASRLSVDSRA